MKRPLSNFRPVGPFVSSSDSDGDPKRVVEDRFSAPLNWVEVYFNSSTDMRELQNNSVALMITSPPYNVNYQYGSVDDERMYVDEYLSELAEVFTEAYKKLTPEGRLCVNVPTIDKSVKESGLSVQERAQRHVSPAADIVNMMIGQQGNVSVGSTDRESEEIRQLQNETNWSLFEHIIWNKGVQSIDGGLQSLGGGNKLPFRFTHDITHESILVFQKPGNRDLSNIPQAFVEASRIDESFWVRGHTTPPEECDSFPMSHTLPKDNLWNIPPGDGIIVNGQQTPTFPSEIPRRLIQSYSYVGDTVVDPFAGTGTTLKVAKEMGRFSAGYELRPELRTTIERRVEEEV